MEKIRLGIDLGGTKIELIALDAQGRERRRQRLPTPQGDYQATLDSIARLVAEAEQELGSNTTVGIGTPGALSPASGLLRNSNSVCLNGQPLLEDLQQRLQRPLRIANDANCFALSEATDGAAAGSDNVFGVIVGTGTGAGIVINGRIVNGCNAIGGEWGHNPLPWLSDDERPGSACYCGRHGCIETFLSGPALQADFFRQHGEHLDSRQIAAGAEQGDARCEAVLQRYEDRMARSLAHVINILDPQVIVLGGGLSNLQRLYANVPAQWGKYVFSDVVNTRLLPPHFGDSSGVRGAAWLWGKDGD